MWIRGWLVSPFLLLIVLSGCAEPEPKKFEPLEYQGKVDTSLPRSVQEKQEVMVKLLNAFREGIGELAGLKLMAPGVDLKESFEDFYDGKPRLVKWDFGGPPSGNDVPVVLYFDDKESGVVDPDKLTKVERTYTVNGNNNKASVARKK